MEHSLNPLYGKLTSLAWGGREAKGNLYEGAGEGVSLCWNSCPDALMSRRLLICLELIVLVGRTKLIVESSALCMFSPRS